MRDVATRLDVTYVALTEAMDQRTAMAAEIEYLRESESRCTKVE
ncbi:hypothetical protein KLMIMMO101B1_00355 [Klebsiella michiganensis]